MARGKSRRDQRDRRTDNRPLERRFSPDQVNRVFLAGAVALAVAAAMVPGEAAAVHGVGAILILLWLLLAVAWSAAAGLLPDRPMRWYPIDFAVVLLAGLHSVSCLVQLDDGPARAIVNVGWQWLALTLSYLLFRALLRTPAARRAVCLVMLGMAVVLATLGLYQVGYAFPRQRARFAAEPQAVLRDAGVSAEPGTPEYAAFKNRLESPEPTGTFALANSLAGVLAPWGIVALAIGLTTRGSQLRSRRFVFGVGFSIAVIGLCLVLTRSRSAVLAATGGVFLVLLLTRRADPEHRRRGWFWAAVAAGVCLIASVLAAAFWDRLVLVEAPKSLLYRSQYWRSTLRLIADHPLWGCGPGNFQNSYPLYKLPEASETIAEPHQFFLEVWATSGTLAAIALLVVLVMAARRAWTTIRAQPTSDPQTGGAEEDPDDTLWPIYASGGCGVLLGLVVSLVMGFASLEIILVIIGVGLPVAGLIIGALHRWGVRGILPEWLPPVAGLVLLVNLLAASGIGFPGVAQTFWLLLAMLVAGASSNSRGITLPRWAWGLVAAVLSALAAGHYATMYRPVLTGQTRLAEARSLDLQRDWPAAEQACREAALADPLSAEPWRLLADLYHSQILRSGQAALAEAFLDADAKIFDRIPNSAALYRESGDRHLRIWAKLGQPRWLENAVQRYERSVALYPNSGVLHAQLAVARQLAGDAQGACLEAALALKLNAVNPHTEQQLNKQLLCDPHSGDATGRVNAELRMQQLRKIP
jgi:O-antigen ligase